MPPKLNKLAFVPIRSGRALGTPWFIWVQGDEIYVASAVLLSAARAKISLHKSGRWFARIDTLRRDFYPLYSRGDRWVVAMHLHFLIPAAPMELAIPTNPRIQLIEVPPGQKLRIDMYVNVEPSFDADGQPSVPASPVYVAELRSGGAYVFTTYTVLPLAEEDRKMMLSAHAEAPSIPKRELIVIGSTREHGNYVVVVPEDSTSSTDQQHP